MVDRHTLTTRSLASFVYDTCTASDAAQVNGDPAEAIRLLGVAIEALREAAETIRLASMPRDEAHG